MSPGHASLEADVVATAERAASTYCQMNLGDLDFREKSLVVVDAILVTLGTYGLAEGEIGICAQDLGCYVLEVARRTLGGSYAWVEKWKAPVLVVGEPESQIALATWDKAAGRIGGNLEDSMAFLYGGFAERARSHEPSRCLG